MIGPICEIHINYSRNVRLFFDKSETGSPTCVGWGRSDSEPPHRKSSTTLSLRVTLAHRIHIPRLAGVPFVGRGTDTCNAPSLTCSVGWTAGQDSGSHWLSWTWVSVLCGGRNQGSRLIPTLLRWIFYDFAVGAAFCWWLQVAAMQCQ